MDPEDYAKQGVDKVYPKYNWMPSTGVQRGNVKSSPIRGDPQTPGYPSVGRKTTTVHPLLLYLQNLSDDFTRRISDKNRVQK